MVAAMTVEIAILRYVDDVEDVENGDDGETDEDGVDGEYMVKTLVLLMVTVIMQLKLS